MAVGSPAFLMPHVAVGLRCCARGVALCACRWYVTSPTAVPVSLGSRVSLLELASIDKLVWCGLDFIYTACHFMPPKVHEDWYQADWCGTV